MFCVASADNVYCNYNDDIIIFIIKGTKLYIPVVTLMARGSQILPKLLSKVFERQVYWNEYRTESEAKTKTSEYKYFFNSNFVGVNRLFVLVYRNQNNLLKRFKIRRYYLPKGIIENYNVIINGKLFL